MRWRHDTPEVNQRFEAGECRYASSRQKGASQSVSHAFKSRAATLKQQMEQAAASLSDFRGQMNISGLIRDHHINGEQGQNFAGFWGSFEITGKPTTYFGANLDQKLSFRRGPWETWPQVLPVLDQPNPRLPIVFSPYCAGLLHEAVGHALEADYLQASPLKHKIGDRLTEADLTVEDQPDLLDGAGSMAFDDAGQKATRTTLLQQGILVGTLAQANGVLRRERFRDNLQQRASNFVIRSGTDSVNTWLEQQPELLYVTWIQAGNWLPGTQKIKLLTGPIYHIKGGKPVAYNPWFRLHFSTSSLLRRIHAVGNDGKRDPIVHFCVKGHQRVPMSLYAPSLLLRGEP